MILRTIVASVLFISLASCGDDAPSQAPTGEACEVSEDCLSNDCRLELVPSDIFQDPRAFVIEGGMCTSACEWDFDKIEPARSRGTCEVGELCLQYGYGDKVCFVQCDSDNPCEREDWECRAIGTEQYACLPS